MNPVQVLDLNAASAPFQPDVGFLYQSNCPLVLLYVLRTLTVGDEREVLCPTYSIFLSIFQVRVVKHAPQIPKIPQNCKTVVAG